MKLGAGHTSCRQPRAPFTLAPCTAVLPSLPSSLPPLALAPWFVVELTCYAEVGFDATAAAAAALTAATCPPRTQGSAARCSDRGGRTEPGGKWQRANANRNGHSLGRQEGRDGREGGWHGCPQSSLAGLCDHEHGSCEPTGGALILCVSYLQGISACNDDARLIGSRVMVKKANPQSPQQNDRPTLLIVWRHAGLNSLRKHLARCVASAAAARHASLRSFAPTSQKIQ